MTSSAPVANYKRIASDYDADRVEYSSYTRDLAAALDEALQRSEAAGCPAVLVDIGCGTGTVLSRFEAESERAYGWSGLGFDRTFEMLGVARTKIFRATVAQAAAHGLPLKDGSAGVLISTFAFHHFGGLAPFLADAHRALAAGGRMILKNILPREGAQPLMYRFFAGTREVDAGRFPLLSELLDALSRSGFRLERHHVTETMHRFEASRYHELCRKRTISQLDLIPDAAFQAGLEAIERHGRERPNELLEECIPVHTLLAEKPVTPPRSGP